MKLVNLKVAGIRGFNDEQPIEFDAKLVIYYGPNGSGKTSIGEAIEWLLYGKTLKRVKGDEISKREYAGSYRNTHYHGAVSPFVEAEIVDNSGKHHIVRRELLADETSRLTVNGTASSDLKDFGIGNLYDRPLILQHTLQDFIHMRPKTRYEVLSAMLGLEPLVDFRNAVEAAKTEVANNLPSTAIEARSRATLIKASFAASPLLQPIVEAIGKGKLGDAKKHLIQVALGRVPAGTAEEDVLPALHQAKASKERARLDWGRFSLNPIASPDSHPAIRELNALQNHFDEFEEHIQEAEKQVAESARETPKPELRQFFELGLNMINDAMPSECPFCLEETLTSERVAAIRKAVEVVPEAKAPLASAQASISLLATSLTGQWQETRKMVPVTPTETERETIGQFVPGGTGQYFASSDVVRQLMADIEQKKKVLDESLKAIQGALKGGGTSEGRIHSLKTSLRTYMDEIKNLPGVANGYAANYAALDPLIRAKLASEADVRFLSTLVEGIENWADIEVSRQIDVIQDELQEIIRQTRQFIENKQREILGQRDLEIRSWYELLCGAAQVGYEGMTPGTDNLELKAKTFAKGMMAAPNLSASQLNCIGLAVYLATCTRKMSPFKCVVFDDPIQSMDDEHTEAFRKQVVSKLLSQGFQVILLTHMDNIADSIGNLYRTHDPAIYRMEQYTQSGPSVVWKGPEIQKILNDIRKNKDATNEGYRKQAVQSLRQFVERFVKDLFTAETGQPISKQYEDKCWADLRNLLRQCKRFEPSDEAILEDTHNFTSPYLHTDESLPQKVPPASHIVPHYESLKGLLDKYKSVLAIK